MTEPFLYTLIPMGASLVGAILAYLFSPRPLLSSFFFYLGLGILLATTAILFLPILVESQQKYPLLLSFGSGIGIMLLLQFLSFQLEKFSTLSMVCSLALSFFIKGMIIALATFIALKTGVLIAFSLTLLIILATYMIMNQVKEKGWKVSMQWLTLFILLFMFPLGAWAASDLIERFHSIVTKTEIIAFTAALLLFLAMQGCFYRAREGWMHPIAFFFGFSLPMVSFSYL